MRSYKWDEANRLEHVKFSDGITEARWDYTYSDRNEVTDIHRYSDLDAMTLVGSSGYGYDDGGRLETIEHKDASTDLIDDFHYLYDAANRVTSETSHLGPDPTYAYDATGQLIDDSEKEYSYDLAGNRTMTDYEHGTGNRLTTDGTWDFTYDDEGNMTKKVNIATDETWEYFYNHLNQLTKAERRPSELDDVDLRAEFKYDIIGKKIEDSLDLDGDGLDPAVITKFAYDGSNAWGDFDDMGSLTTRRLYENAIDAVFARIDANGDLAFYLTDRLGSVRGMVDDTGTLQTRLAYDGYGNILTETDPGYGDRYKFTGREWHVEIELQYNRARWYDPSIGRWISEDPIRFDAGDSNLYRYVKNQPTMGTDPSGLDFILLTGRPTAKISESATAGDGISGGHYALEYWKADEDPVLKKFYNQQNWTSYMQSVRNKGNRLERVASVELLQTEGWKAIKVIQTPFGGTKSKEIDVNISFISYDLDVKIQHKMNFDESMPVNISKGFYNSPTVKKTWNEIIARAKLYPYAEQPGWDKHGDGKEIVRWPHSYYEITPFKVITSKTNNSNTFVHHMLTSAALEYSSFTGITRKYAGKVVPAPIPNGEDYLGPPWDPTRYKPGPVRMLKPIPLGN